jgi:hypothetical protein
MIPIMLKLKIESILGDKPVKISTELPADVHRDLMAYADVLKRQNGQVVDDPTKLIAPMLKRFMATDRAFKKLRRSFPDTRIE